MRKSWFIVILFCLLGSSVANVLAYNQLSSPITASYSQPETSYVEVPDLASKEIIVEKLVEKLVEKPMELREFVSLQKLVDWLEQDDTDSTLYFTGTVDFSASLGSNYDCDDFAYRLQKSTLAEGYLMSTEIIVKKGKQHMINSTSIGNNIYFIEPQTDEVWFETYRD